MKATVAERGQVTIPKPLRDKLGIRAGTRLDFRDRDGKLIAVKVDAKDPVDAVTGVLGKGRGADRLMTILRGSVRPDEIPGKAKEG